MVVHEEPAAQPHPDDANYRLARNMLACEEEWAQETQRSIKQEELARTHSSTHSGDHDNVRAYAYLQSK